MQSFIKKLNLSKLGIKNIKEIYHNPSYDELYKHEINPKLEGFEKGFVTNTGAVSVDTGVFTGRSPKDKYIVRDKITQKNIWWADPDRPASDNKPINKKIWKDLLAISAEQLSGKRLYVQDGFAGTNDDTRIRVRVITEVAWMAHFVKNMFIRPTEKEMKSFNPDFILINACKTFNEKWHEHDLNSDVFVAFNLQEKMAVIGGTWYGGEIKKGIFSIMNYYLPLKNIASMHCSANMGKKGDTALFFGLSGTGKTTLSTDPNRYLIGDDEHGWDNEGIFNFEGGCYAKCINLSREKEPDIFNAIKRDALLENVVYNEKGEINFFDSTKTENTRVSYPINHINNIVKPVSKGSHPKYVIFLTADAFGVFPPVAKLTDDQAMYYFLSGYTAKLAGTERGVKEPIPTFSPGFGAAFLLLHPTIYAKILMNKMLQHGTKAYLVNTGWIGGPYGRGKRIELSCTRKIINAILDGYLDNVDYFELPIFGLNIPLKIPGVDSNILNPRKAWKYEARYVKQAQMLAEKFIHNFQFFTDIDDGKRLVAAGPKDKFTKQFYDYYATKIRELEEKHNIELQRLKDHIYILQESYSDYISFNSINTDFKKAKVNRYLPVVSYFNTCNEKESQKINIAAHEILDSIGYKYLTDEDIGAKYNKFIAVSKDPITRSEEEKLLSQLYHNAVHYHGKQNTIKCALKKFYKAAQGIDDVVLKIGSYVIVKKDDKDKAITKWVVKKLTISGQIYIDKNPDILKSPVRMFNELTAFLT